MKHYHFALLLCLMAIAGCGQKEHDGILAYEEPADMATFLKLYDWYQSHEGENRDSVVLETFTADMPEDEFYLFTDTCYLTATSQSQMTAKRKNKNQCFGFIATIEEPAGKRIVFPAVSSLPYSHCRFRL